MKIDILGVKIDRVCLTEALAIAEKWIWNPGKHYIVTPNLEFILAAQKDREFREILNKADLAIPDSFRLGLSYWLLKKSRLERLLFWPLFFFPIKIVMQFDVVTGTDLMESLCKLSAEKGFTVGFLGGRDEVAKKCAERLRKKYPKLKVVFAEDGGEVDDQGNILRPSEASGEVTEKTIIVPKVSSRYRSNNNIPPTDILFVALGHIKQEKWIAKNLPNLSVKVAMGVGGAFDYLSGSVPRAPKWLRGMGFEWLFRLIIQPWRIKRQLALVKFIFYIMVN